MIPSSCGSAQLFLPRLLLRQWHEALAHQVPAETRATEQKIRRPAAEERAAQHHGPASGESLGPMLAQHPADHQPSEAVPDEMHRLPVGQTARESRQPRRVFAEPRAAPRGSETSPPGTPRAAAPAPSSAARSRSSTRHAPARLSLEAAPVLHSPRLPASGLQAAGLLLRQAMERAQPPDQFAAINRHDLPARQRLAQHAAAQASFGSPKAGSSTTLLAM